jgi:DNA-directed RNA polymerase specialized sigma24 family protein
VRARRRSEDPTDELVEWLAEGYAPAFRTAFVLLGNRADAEEAVQDAFLRAWRFRAAVPDGDGVRPWLYRVVVNASLSKLRSDGRRRTHTTHLADDPAAEGGPGGRPPGRSDLQLHAADPETRTIDGEARQTVLDAVAALAPSPTSPPTPAPVAPPPTSSPPSSGEAPSGETTLRVPVANFASLLTQVQTLGKVVSVSSSGQDVTSQYVDLQAQIQALQASRTQLLKVLDQAQSISDILAVEAQIAPLESQIEQLQGQQKVLTDQTTYGTLSVSLTETVPAKATIKPPPPPKPPSGVSKAWTHARHSFTHGLESVISASGGIAVFLLSVLALYVVGRIGWRLTRRRLV